MWHRSLATASRLGRCGVASGRVVQPREQQATTMAVDSNIPQLDRADRRASIAAHDYAHVRNQLQPLLTAEGGDCELS